VLPETNNIVVVVGNSPLEKFWVGQLREAFQPFANRVAITWFNELSFEDMLKRSATLPPESAIFFVVLSVDAAGVTHEGGKAAERLHAVANAPMFSWSDIYLGKGIVGGPLIPALEMGRKAASAAVRILNGEAPSDIRTEPIGFGTPRFDWREMQRWNISEASLPPGSVIEFREPTIFEQYKWYIIAIFAVCLIQAAVITVLWLERIHRRRAERAARDFCDRLITVQEDERSRLARELHDDVTQRLAALAIEVGRVQNRGSKQGIDATMREVREGLVKLSEDVHALSYRLHPSILDDLGLVDALKAECERFSRLELIPVDVKIEDNFIAPPPQIALCLFRIAEEALQNVGRHARASQIEVSLQRSDRGFRICIRDNGVGFEPEHPHERASLGLASMQQRIYRLGGKLNIDSTPGNGTMVFAWVPAREEHHESPARAVG
jgi:signal transduction histidine kinase